MVTVQRKVGPRLLETPTPRVLDKEYLRIRMLDGKGKEVPLNQIHNLAYRASDMGAYYALLFQGVDNHFQQLHQATPEEHYFTPDDTKAVAKAITGLDTLLETTPDEDQAGRNARALIKTIKRGYGKTLAEHIKKIPKTQEYHDIREELTQFVQTITAQTSKEERAEANFTPTLDTIHFLAYAYSSDAKTIASSRKRTFMLHEGYRRQNGIPQVLYNQFEDTHNSPTNHMWQFMQKMREISKE